jgi:hypothetical protein
LQHGQQPAGGTARIVGALPLLTRTVLLCLLHCRQVVNNFFGKPPNRWAPDYREPFWPAIADENHGYVAGLKYLKYYRDMSDADFQRTLTYGLNAGTHPKPVVEGVIPEAVANATRDGRQIWQALDLRYDFCVGQCVPNW